MRSWAWFLLLCLVCAPTTATAQRSSRGSSSHHGATNDTSRARALFEQGIHAAGEEHWDDALTAFADSYSIDPRPATLMNLAGALAKTGRLLDSIQSYRRFLSQPLSTDLERLRASVTEAVTTIEARLAHVKLLIRGTHPTDIVSVDGASLSTTDRASAISIDPGEHWLRVERDSAPLIEQSFTVAESQTVDLLADVGAQNPTISLRSPTADTHAHDATTQAGTDSGANPETAPATTASSQDSDANAAPHAGRGRKIAAYTLLGAGVAGAVLGGIFHAQRQHQASLYNASCSELNETSDCAAIHSKVNSDTTIAIVGYAAGAALIVTGITLLLLPTHDRAQPTHTDDHAHIDCGPSFGTWGMTCAGTF